MTTLDEWTTQLAAALGVPVELVDRSSLLDLARDAAHGVARPAAPLTTYLAGLAIGRGATPEEVMTTIRSLLPPAPES
jgi:hypothetical protein